MNTTVTVPEAEVKVHVGPDFFAADREEKVDVDGDAPMAEESSKAPTEADADADGEADDAASFGSLFDDDAEGEEEGDATMTDAVPAPPSSSAPVPAPVTPALTPLLALPGTNKPTPTPTPTPAPVKPPGKLFPIPPSPAVRNGTKGMPLLSSTEFKSISSDVLLTASMNGQVTLVDRRVGGAVGRLQAGERAPPWCMSVSLPATLSTDDRRRGQATETKCSQGGGTEQ